MRLWVKRHDRDGIQFAFTASHKQSIERQRLRRHRHREMPIARGGLQHFKILQHLAGEAARREILVDHLRKGGGQEV